MEELIKAVMTALSAYEQDMESEDSPDISDVSVDKETGEIYAIIDGTPVAITIEEL